KTDVLVNAGPFAAFLGQAHDPVWTDFDGQGIRLVPRYSEGQPKQFMDPYGGCTTAGRFKLSTEASLPDDLPLERLALRRSLLTQFEEARRAIDRDAVISMDTHRQRAFSLLTAGTIRTALDLGRETQAVRENYGMTLFGQACLAARRLVEAGS